MVQGDLRISFSQDFEQIWCHYAGVKNRRLEDTVKAKRGILAVHKFACVTAIVSKAVEEKQQPEHTYVFLMEFASDALHLLHALLVGDRRSGHLYLRSCIENVWRHIYFKDHPVEYRWANSDSGLYQSMDDLRSYCKKSDELDPRLQKSLDRIASGYRKLSGFVHSSGESSLQLHGMLSEIRLPYEALKDIVSDLRSFGRDLVLLCLILHAKEMTNLHPWERRYAIDYLDKPRKQLRTQVLA